MGKVALIAGATGLVGGSVLEQLVNGAGFERVIVLTRRALPGGPKVEQWTSTSDDLLSALKPERVDIVLCCLGTTIKTAGSQAAFYKVDHDLVLGLGEWAQANGVDQFCVVSAIGADADSGVFYNRVKGETERDLKALGLAALHIFQPSILTGPRKEKRVAERIGIAVMKFFAPLLPAKYRPMPHDVLARAMINAAGRSASDTYTYRGIKDLAKT